MSLTAYSAEYLLKMIRDDCWISLHFDNPDLAGGQASEITGGGYSRLKASFGEISNRTMWLDDTLKFEGLRQTKITYIGGWTDKRGGNSLFFSELANPGRISDGGLWKLEEKKLVISIA